MLKYLAFPALPAKHGENTSFAHNYCVNGPISKILTVLESACFVPKLVKLSLYYMTYVARGSTAKKLRYIFNFWWLKALAERGNAEYRAILIGCKCGIAPNCRIFFYYNKIKIIYLRNSILYPATAYFFRI